MKVFIEHKPEHYVSPSITVTIHTKPSHRFSAEALAKDIEALLDGYDGDHTGKKVER